ncbi:hypothetical protein BD780_002392 [Clostridium tetanomorphum]|nr:hypothetical protein [Clostridium tetanomorphum]MBP1865244.1 hypothetical protein [Clostridium tetanomorphum]NRS85167.1 hypothetical protein [Clostridium tetanomorphum]SQC03129.1 Uncharacterised protein [Clostridium tetanomorphum]
MKKLPTLNSQLKMLVRRKVLTINNNSVQGSTLKNQGGIYYDN